MAHNTHLTCAAIVIAFLLVAIPTFGEDDKDSNPPAEKQPAIQIRLQPRAFPIGAFNNPLNLYRNEKVLEELKLDDAQKSKIEELVKAASTQRQKTIAGLRGLQGDERQKKAAEFRKNVLEKTAELMESLRATLKPEQSERLDQISIQIRGVQALSDAKVAKKLKLTDEQKKQIEGVAATGRQKRMQLSQDVRNGNVERAKLQEKIKAITNATETETTDVLTEEQQAQFEKMKGEKFDMPQRRFQLQAVPLQPGQLKKIQIQPNANKIQIRIQAAPKN